MGNWDSLDGSYKFLEEMKTSLSWVNDTVSLWKTNGNWYKIEKMNDELQRSIQQLKPQFDYANRVFRSPIIQEQLDLYNQLGKSMAQAVSVYSKIFDSPSMRSYMIEIQELKKSFALFEDSVWRKLIASLDSVILEQQVERTIPILSNLDSSVIEAARTFDSSSVQINSEGDISFEGNKYSGEEIIAELDNQIRQAQPEKLTLKEKFEELQKKFWLLIFVINIIIAIPDIPDKIEFYRDITNQVISITQEIDRIAYTIRDYSYLRSEPNAKSTLIMVLPYDSYLEIIEDAPRWYKVKFINENGDEIIGWISKISVEIGQ